MISRLNKVKSEMKKKNVRFLLITKPENQLYLTGFKSSNCKLLITGDVSYLLTDFRYIEAAGELSSLYSIVQVDNKFTLFSFLKDIDLSELAIEEGFLTYEDAEKIRSESGASLINGGGIVESVRIVKEESELDMIKKAQEIADKGFLHMLDYLRPGLSEKEAALELEMFLRKEGADSLAFSTILVSGLRTSLPHGGPSDKILENGDFITMDFGCKVDNYCSDMTRTVALGKVSAKQKEIYEIVLQAQKAGCGALSPGLSCRDADKTCRDIISGQGYGDFFGHGTGHGLGLEVHEAPTLNPKSNEELKAGMVVTVEPGIYIPKEFGVRIEDLAIISDSGIINLVKAEKELIIIK